MKNTFLFYLIGIYLLTFVFVAHSQDVPGSKDHEMISRFPGSKITKYDARKYDEYRFIKRKMPLLANLNSENTMRAEGEFTELVYETPGERTTLEVFRNYRSALINAGLKVEFECEGKPNCGSEVQFINGAGKPLTGNLLRNGDQRYLFGKLRTASGTFYISVYTMRGATSGLGTIYTRLNIIETDEMETGLISVSAESMQRLIATTGRVSLYGIFFDTGSDVVKSESKPTLEEIAKLLGQNPGMDLLVIGHTDNVGGFDYNIGLSERRAKAVVELLVTKYGVNPKRLRGYGIGYVAPVTTNRTDEGRTKNRRVELVEQ